MTTGNNSFSNKLKALTLNIARAVVTRPAQVQVEVTVSDSLIVLELRAASEDMGRVIGRKGQLANALRTLLSTIAAKEGRRVNLNIAKS